jgi:hypothetical protein
VAVTQGFNITSATATGTAIDVTLASAVNASALVMVAEVRAAGPTLILSGAMNSTTLVTIRALALSDVSMPIDDVYDFDASAAKVVGFIVLSPQ